MKRLQLARRLATAYGLWPETLAVLVVGSVARAEDDDHADLDLLVVLDRPLPREIELVELEATLASGGRVDFGRGGPRMLRFVGEQAVDLQLRTTAGLSADISAVIDGADADPLRHATCRALREAVAIEDASVVAAWRAHLEEIPRATSQALVGRGLSLVPQPALVSALKRGDGLRFRELLLELAVGLAGCWAGLAGDLHPGRLGGLPLVAAHWDGIPDRGPARLQGLLESTPLDALERADALVRETCDLAERAFPELDVTQARSRWREGDRPFRAERRRTLRPTVH